MLGEILGEIIGQIFVEAIGKPIGWVLRTTFHATGAAVKWLWFLGKKSFQYCYEDRGTGRLGLFLWIVGSITIPIAYFWLTKE